MPKKVKANDIDQEYLKNSLKLTIKERIQFVENMKLLSQNITEDRSILISLKVKTSLLQLFRKKCDLENVKYQTKIKELMGFYLKS